MARVPYVLALNAALALALAATVGCAERPAASREAGVLASAGGVTPDAPTPPTVPPRVIDPLAPARDVTVVRADASGNDWVTSRPAKETQFSLDRASRGGVNPCEAPDPGLGIHDDWISVRPMGQVSAPRALTLSDDGSFDAVVHFHGHRPARKELVRTGEDLVLVGLSLGIGKAYGTPFSDPALFESIVRATERAIARRSGVHGARVRRLALSSWSRGYEAIAEVLSQPMGGRVDAIVLLDSLHASREPARGREQLAPFLQFAARATRGETFAFVSHSSIDTPDYASTTETAHALVASVGGRPTSVLRRDPLGLDLLEMFDHGSLHVRGYRGNGKLDHCAHFGVYPDALRAIARRWRRAPGR